MEGVGETFTHAVDPGGPITVVVPTHVEPCAKERRLRLQTLSCTSPECECIKTEIEVTEDGTDVSATLSFDPETRLFEIVRDRAGLLAGSLNPWLQAELAGLTGDYIETRARRAKLQHCAHPWRVHDWSEHVRGNLVSYFEAIPGDFDLVAQLAGQRFWAHDMYCVRPDCDCRQVALEFHACEANGAHNRSGMSLGVLRVDLVTGQVTEAEQPRARAVFEALRRAYSIDELRYRYGRMREMAQDVGPRFGQPKTAPWTVPTRVERNQHCPCGSGKKYKKCCGAAGALG